MDNEEVEEEPQYDSAGVDVTLIRWMLSLTPAERLEQLQDFADFMWEVRGRHAQDELPRDDQNPGEP